GRNAIFITGGADPWYPLGVYFNRSSVVSYRSPGTAHCADMYVPRKIDKPGLAVARRLVKENIAKWLGIRLEKSSNEEAADPKHEEQQQKQ
ncbi:unnamed protein product, partial [Anisakis simplex]|uniref:Serine protease n=1 Tax=Anisakis simplex TaxID=6269 RepID=A0A0M3JHT5_ANISI